MNESKWVNKVLMLVGVLALFSGASALTMTLNVTGTSGTTNSALNQTVNARDINTSLARWYNSNNTTVEASTTTLSGDYWCRIDDTNSLDVNVSSIYFYSPTSDTNLLEAGAHIVQARGGVIVNDINFSSAYYDANHHSPTTSVQVNDRFHFYWTLTSKRVRPLKVNLTAAYYQNDTNSNVIVCQ